MGAILTKLKPIIRMYLIFAFGHTLYKILRLLRRLRLKRTTWSHIPGQPYDPTYKVVRENMNRLHDFRTEMIQKQGDTDFVSFDDMKLIAVKRRSVEWLLKLEFDRITKPDPEKDLFFYSLSTFLGKSGIFTIRHGKAPHLAKDNAQWFHQRKTASMIFTKNQFTSLMYETFLEKIQMLLQLCEKHSQTQQKLDIQQKFFAFTIDSIQMIFFGRKVDTILKEETDEFGFAFDEANRCSTSFTLGNLPVYNLCQQILPFPFGDIFDRVESSLIMCYLRYFSENAQPFRDSIKSLRQFGHKMVSAARKDKGIQDRRDLLALFLTSKMDFTDKELVDIILNLTIAGRDTTACTMTWMVYMLTQNPDVEKKMCEEIDSVLQGRTPSFDAVNPENMPYLNGVLMEALRLHPPVPVDGKVVEEDVTYLDGTKIPKGTRVLFTPYTMGRDPKVYPNPLKVDPNRWIPYKLFDQYQFPVFQAGPRICLGKDMAQFEAKLVIASLYQKFTFKLLDGEAEKITYARAVTMSLCNSKEQDSFNLWVIPQKRS